MALTGEGEGALDRLAVELGGSPGGMLADHREEVAEQLAFGPRQLAVDLVDRRWARRALAEADMHVAARRLPRGLGPEALGGL